MLSPIIFSHLFKMVDEAGYDGGIGCEYRPRGLTEDGLSWRETLL